ncbi:response regulator receiver signal transduction histidine kinase [Calothrix sp. NIES-4071]|nr:response regulator receiver signal transduction histidine kinase [Calothrix sp. NIES-4071]BAZ54575.1 response regulator receiver signal transduction histidine kinase [Calothrix sp. NIES-4105]
MLNIFSTQNLDRNRVLVVDDNIDNTLLLATLLEMEGYLVDTAYCGYTAISKIEANPPNIVLIDFMMPGIDGIGVAQWVRKNRPSVAIVLVTAYTDFEDLHPSIVKFDGITIKPLDLEKTVSLIQDILNAKQMTNHKYNQYVSIGCYY